MIDVSELTIAAGTEAVLERTSLRIESGERIALVGRSGAGKTTLALALLGHVRSGMHHVSGHVECGGLRPLSMGPKQLRAFRREVTAYLPQDPATALTATMRIRDQLTELSGPRTTEQLLHRLTEVGLPGDPALLKRFPHQLSGGQRQRLALARAIAADPDVLVLDEPTTGLDTVTRALIVELIDEVVRRRELTSVIVTHDREVCEQLADRTVSLAAGRVESDGAAAAPPIPRPRRPAASETVPDDRPVLEARGITAFHGYGIDRYPVVLDVSLELRRSESIGLVGSSGSGKTTLARSLSGRHPACSGELLVDGRSVGLGAGPIRSVQLIPQDATASLNPRRSVGATVAAPLRLLRGLRGKAVGAEVARLLDSVGLPKSIEHHRPGQLSGGQCRRVAIARALACAPQVLLCDEITSDLDPQTQKSVMDLLVGIRAEFGTAVLMVTHDLELIARYTDRLLILQEGRIRHAGPTAEVMAAPSDPWTGYPSAAG
ncbi:MAG TPA: ATP-binding cassette domain-containing protein [Glycomyces sp.]|nr:ATP-binding cassette domain-containing protein [Glycomyces sp.]